MEFKVDYISLNAADKLSSFVRVILQNVTLDTEVGKGVSPTWEQEFVL